MSKVHDKLVEMTNRAHRGERLLNELPTMIKVLRRALLSLDELHCKTGMIEFWGESDEMPKFIHHPVKHAESDVHHVLSRLRQWEVEDE